MNKIVILHGVGFHGDDAPNNLLISELKKNPDNEVVWYNWKHYLEIPKIDLPYTLAREWACEVILDFQTVIKHAFDLTIPEADFYIGHSAGSILALIQNRPSIIFGSPAILVDTVQGSNTVDCLLNSPKVLNIIHKRDVLAYPFPFPHVDNQYINNNWWNFMEYNPVSAHTCYWDDKTTVQKILSTLQEWKKQSSE